MSRWGTGGESGSVLLWVMVVGLFVVGALGAATRLIPSGTLFTSQDADTTFAFIAAESGIHYVVDKAAAEGAQVLANLNTDWIPLGTAGSSGKASAFRIASDGEYVYVTGRAGDAQRTIRAKLPQARPEPETHPPFDAGVAVFAVAGPGARFPALRLSGGAEVRDAAGTNATAPGSVKIEGGPIFGDILVGPVDPAQAAMVVDKPNWMQLPGQIIPLPEPRVFPLPPFPDPAADLPWRDLPWRGSLGTTWDNPTLVIRESGRYDTIRAGSGTWKVVFDTSGGDLYVRAGTMRADGSGFFEVVGDGRLYLYVDQTFKLEGSGSFNANGSRASALVFYAGSATLDLHAGARARGIFYNKSAPVHIAGGFAGDVWVLSAGSTVQFAGGANLANNGIVYAPNAHVDVTGGAKAVMVVGNSVHVSGGAQILKPKVDWSGLPGEWWEGVDEGDDGTGAAESLEWHVCWTDCGSVAEN